MFCDVTLVCSFIHDSLLFIALLAWILHYLICGVRCMCCAHHVDAFFVRVCDFFDCNHVSVGIDD
jgi:hypothetical protein